MGSLHQVGRKTKPSFRYQYMRDGERITMTLGQISKKAAEAAAFNIGEIVACVGVGASLPPKTIHWLQEVDDELYAKLAVVGLVPHRNTDRLGPLLERYINIHAGGKAPSTLEKWGFCKDRLIEHFGPDRAASFIARPDAEGYGSWLFQVQDFALSTHGRENP